MPPITHFEVHAFEDGRWTLQQRFVSSERDKAVDEAKSLESFLKIPTKVIREYHNPQSGMSDEHVIYLSPKAKALKEQAMKAREAALAGGSRPHARIPEGLESFSSYSYTDQDLADRRYARSVGDLLGRVLLVITASLILAAMGTSLIPALANLLRLGGSLGFGNMGDVLFGIFLFLFLVSTTLIGRKLLPLAGFLATPPPKRAKVAAPKPAAATQEETKPPDTDEDEEDPENKEPDFDPIALMDEYEELGKPTPPEPDPQDEERKRREAERLAKRKAEAEEKARKIREEAERKKAEAEAEAARVAAAAAEAAETELDSVGEEDGDPEVDQARTMAMTFLGGMVAALKTISVQLDVFTRFGLNLFLVGACEALAGRLALPEQAQKALLREMLEVMGTRPALALMFTDKLEEYLMDPRYMRMVQAGRDAMWTQLAEGEDPFRSLSQLMADWNTPRAKSSTTSTIAIVFTDMVGSTDINSKVGDVLARDITRVHNTIVRSALSRFDGREVKHTGDGIMATFQVISQAAEAAVDIQRAVAAHNIRRPDIAIDLRIGVNAGEPVVEENDYYGIAVTLAARICAEAEGGSILCSGVVRDLSQGKDLRFRDRGQAKLKGISDPQRLFEIIWNPDTPTAEDETKETILPPLDQDPTEPSSPLPISENAGENKGKAPPDQATEEQEKTV